MLLVGYKFRIYPTDEQKDFFEKHFGCCRFTYNYLLNLREESYKKFKKSISGFEAKKQIAVLKKTEKFKWLKEVNSQSLQEASLDLEKAYIRFFKKLGKKPRFKRKFHRQKFKVPQFFRLKKSKRNNYFLTIPKIKSSIRVNVHREIIGEINQITIIKEPSGEYFVGFNCEMKKENIFKRKDNKKNSIGVDLGLTSFIATSEGNKKEAPKYLRKTEHKLKTTQRNLSRKCKGSLNRKKEREKVAKIHLRIANQRKDFLHKVSFELVDENQVIYLENLHVKGMLQNRGLSKSITDAGWSEFKRQLKYKAKWRDKEVVEIGRFEPSSKLCSMCEFKNEELKLHQREWVCSNCGTKHDRDVNAAKNIVKLGQDMSKVKPVEKTTSIFSLKRKGKLVQGSRNRILNS